MGHRLAASRRYKQALAAPHKAVCLCMKYLLHASDLSHPRDFTLAGQRRWMSLNQISSCTNYVTRWPPSTTRHAVYTRTLQTVIRPQVVPLQAGHGCYNSSCPITGMGRGLQCLGLSTCYRWPAGRARRGELMRGGARGENLAGRPSGGSEGSAQSYAAHSATPCSHQPAPPPPALVVTWHLLVKTHSLLLLTHP